MDRVNVLLPSQLNTFNGEDIDRRTVTFGADEVGLSLDTRKVICVFVSNDQRACQVV